MSREKFAILEQQCESAFESNGPFWHMCTPGANIEILFTDREELRYGMNLTAMCRSLCPNIEIYTHTVMNNHIHAIISGNETLCLNFFIEFRKRLQRYLTNKGRNVDMSGFVCNLIPIENIQSLRNEIVYANRNGYVINPKCTPFSYEWSAGIYFFNPILKNAHHQLGKRVSPTYGRKIFKTREMFKLDNLLFYNDTAIPTTYCSIDKAESFFRDAHHYFNLLTKDWEAYSAISKRLRDTVFLTDEEMFSAVSSYTSKSYNNHRPSTLSPKEKIEVAKKMHFEYNANNRQIKSILKLDTSIVQELFPKG